MLFNPKKCSQNSKEKNSKTWLIKFICEEIANAIVAIVKSGISDYPMVVTKNDCASTDSPHIRIWNPLGKQWWYVSGVKFLFWMDRKGIPSRSCNSWLCKWKNHWYWQRNTLKRWTGCRSTAKSPQVSYCSKAMNLGMMTKFKIEHNSRFSTLWNS